MRAKIGQLVRVKDTFKWGHLHPPIIAVVDDPEGLSDETPEVTGWLRPGDVVLVVDVFNGGRGAKILGEVASGWVTAAMLEAIDDAG